MIMVIATLLYTLQCIEVVDQSLDHLGHLRPKMNILEVEEASSGTWMNRNNNNKGDGNGMRWVTGEEMSNMSEGLKGPTLEEYSSSTVQYSTRC